MFFISMALLFTSQNGPLSCGNYCFTGMGLSRVEYIKDSCCEHPDGYDYCCFPNSKSKSKSDEFCYWKIAPIVIGAIVFIGIVVAFVMCCCRIAADGKTPYQAWTSRREAATSIEMNKSENQQQSTMSNLPVPQQQYPQVNSINQQPQTFG